MKNIVFFASDAKGLSSMNSIIKEASKEGHRLFAMVTQQSQLQHPVHKASNFKILCNLERKAVTRSDTLGVDLPFIPDVLIVNRERWDPEDGIIKEFKRKFNAKVLLVEPNAWLLSNAETKLETYSRSRYAGIVDTFFMHSTHAVEQQKAMGFTGNMEVVGNPKYDLNTNVTPETLEQLRALYSLSEGDSSTLMFSLVNQHRSNLNKIFQDYVHNNKGDRYFYKSYPGEPFDPKFRNDFHPRFFLPGTIPIIEENHIWGMFELCDTHVGCMSSIVHATLLKGKKYVDVSLALGVDEKYLDFSGVFQESGPGLENNKAMWMRSFGFTQDKQLRDLLSDEYKQDIKTLNNKVWSNLDNPEKLLTLFDDYNDGNAGKRIIKYIQNEL